MNSSETRCRAFSVVECLLVVAIIAVLIGLLIPFSERVRERMGDIRCLGNLRKIGVATSLYIGEHQGELFPTKFFYTPPALGNYLDLPQKTQRPTVFTCPALSQINGAFPEESWHHRTYSINYYILPTADLRPRRIQEIAQPREMILIADGVAVFPGFSNTITPAQARDVQSTLYPHHNLNNALFLDGHVRGVELETMSQDGYSPFWGRKQ